MTTQSPIDRSLRELLSPISREMLDRWAAEDAVFRKNVAVYVAQWIDNTRAPGEPHPLQRLQARMLEHLLLQREPGEGMSPVDLADAIGERNRRAVREAGRHLIAKGAMTAETEPCDGAEGERVLNYAYGEAMGKALNTYLEAQHLTLAAETAAAVKQ